ncbi:hypothetical protein TPHA_0M00220 [Tetrapisispora phaffii CBS 4417]|uniref:Uncharacterized protein n=1 Tax=Tetrapisispora phaffii (strain ATCC 24235 / CBS 4417 / NBRC 1672 / NRRL Y-8282 / UCD 70-5) TaxID=1071381 RepID=G8C0T9_TETPH|nr:hypothetical protein TPHA_0M00220 [Tetrapisispora phaffii CBS 4417]CCE65600.1 hypothetical protein TPHA_0M00220 [Tetrapisispora phaffii CBS 4417]
MAPATPVVDREAVAATLQASKQRNRQECELKALTQYECQFVDLESNRYICRPFKRLFEVCAGTSYETTAQPTNSADRS